MRPFIQGSIRSKSVNVYGNAVRAAPAEMVFSVKTHPGAVSSQVLVTHSTLLSAQLNSPASQETEDAGRHQGTRAQLGKRSAQIKRSFSFCQ